MWRKTEKGGRRSCLLRSFSDYFFQNIHRGITVLLLQSLANYGPWAKSDLRSVLINKVLWRSSYTHPFIHCV